MAEVSVATEFEEKETREMIIERKEDFLEGLLEAAEDADEETLQIDIIRNEKHISHFLCTRSVKRD